MKLLILLLSLSILTGCSTLQSLASGGSSKTVAIDALGNPVVDRFGRTKYNTTTTSKSAEIMMAAQQAVANLPVPTTASNTSCGGLNFSQITQLAPSAQSEIMKCFAEAERNRPLEIMGQALANATKPYVSEAHAIFAEARRASDGVQNAALGKWNAVTSFGFKAVVAHEAGATVRTGYETQRDVGIAAAETGNTTNVGDITVSSSQHASADGNTGGAGGSAGEGSGGAGGDGTGTSTNTRSGLDQTIINIGGNTNAGMATDDAMVQSGTSFSQQLEPSANGSVVNQSKLNGSDTVDELTGDKEVSDNDGGQSLF